LSSAVVVGYDGEDAADRALDRAIEEASGAHGKLVVVAVSEMPLNPEGPQNFGTLDDSPAQMIPLVEPAELGPVFEEARDKIDRAGLRADYVWAAGEPSNAIVAAARDHKARLVVLGSHHHSWLSRMVGGDVAAQVKRDAGCDVLVVD
jgi:nucleotide-binding universal stress UspA family protein